MSQTQPESKCSHHYSPGFPIRNHDGHRTPNSLWFEFRLYPDQAHSEGRSFFDLRLGVGKKFFYLHGTSSAMGLKRSGVRLFFRQRVRNVFSLASEMDWRRAVNRRDIHKPIAFGIQLNSRLIDTKLREIIRESSDGIDHERVTW